MSCRSKDLHLSLFEGDEMPHIVLATAQMVDLAALVEALLREIATAPIHWLLRIAGLYMRGFADVCRQALSWLGCRR